MEDLYRFLGVRFSRKLRWYDYAVMVWITLSLCALTFDEDTTPILTAVLIVANFCASLWAGKKILPDVYDEDDEETSVEG